MQRSLETRLILAVCRYRSDIMHGQVEQMCPGNFSRHRQINPYYQGKNNAQLYFSKDIQSCWTKMYS